MAEDKKKRTTPSPPSDVKVNGRAESDEMATQSTGEVEITAKIDDPTAGQEVALKAEWFVKSFSAPLAGHTRSDFGRQGRRATVHLRNLKRNTLYKVKLWTIAKKQGPDQVSKSYTSVSFWTNRPPTVELVQPIENSEFAEGQTILFDWKYTDPDHTDDINQVAWQIRIRAEGGTWKTIPAKTKANPDGVQRGAHGKDTFHTIDSASLAANTVYFWTVVARDPKAAWSEAPLPQSFFVRGTSSPPKLLAPIGGIGRAINVDNTVLFTWDFRDPDPTNKQQSADIRWRAVEAGVELGPDEAWNHQFGEPGTPGTAEQWEIEGGFFTPGVLYEWQVRTYDDKNTGIPSGWSLSGEFVAATAPGSGLLEPLLPEQSLPLGALGCGHHRVFIYDRGGTVLRGEIKPLARVQWGRKRDDISNALITTNGFDQDCCTMLGALQSWVHEIVIYRDGVRVFEGPVTRITYTAGNVEIEAKDVMAYLYRRVMRQGYNDRYQRIDINPKTPAQPIGRPGGGPYVIIGSNSVVERALQIALNALAYQDPNVLPYLTAIQYADDATEQRVVPDYNKTAWEEIDSLAATGGLDYTTVGRRIIFWDTHRSIGRLPEMRDGDFSEPVIVTEYGMLTSNFFAVTNNSGVAGTAYPLGLNGTNWFQRYGPVEMVASAYGEKEGEVTTTEALTQGQLDKLQASLTKQAKLGIANRWPTPVVVRVPDNSTINPQVNLGINQLVPGVWIPLRATQTCRKLAQWQKLDSVDVEEVEDQEFVRVTMSPAPHGGDDDPDLNAVGEG